MPLWKRIALAIVPALLALYLAGRGYGAAYGEGSRLAWLEEDAAPGEVRVGGALRANESGERPLCSIIHQRWAQCGKNKCWTWYAGMLTADGTLVADDGTRLALGSSFKILPREPGDTSWAHEVDPARAKAVRARAARSGLSGFGDRDFVPAQDHRIVERCLEEDTRVFAIGCAGEGGLGPCAGQDRWTVIPGDGTPQPALDEAANDVLYWFAFAFAAMLVASLLLYPGAEKLAFALERRAGARSRAHGWAWALLAIPAGVLATSLLQRGSLPQTSTWAHGRGGYAAASAVAACLAIVALSARRRRSVLRHAVEPVLRTPRSLLAQARDATVELHVKSAAAPAVDSAVSGEGVALSILQIDEVYAVGKSTQSRSLHHSIVPNEIAVSDESGDGRLDLTNSIVDGEVRKLTTREPVRALVDRAGPLERHESHTQYVATETVLLSGAPLYVLGEVAQIEMKGSEEGYRSVRGSPTLGGADAPLLVYAGSERGLVDALSAEHSSLGLVLSCALGSLAMLLAAIAWLAAR